MLSFFYDVRIAQSRGKVRTNIRGWKSKLVKMLKPFYDVRENGKGEVYIVLKRHNREDKGA